MLAKAATTKIVVMRFAVANAFGCHFFIVARPCKINPKVGMNCTEYIYPHMEKANSRMPGYTMNRIRCPNRFAWTCQAMSCDKNASPNKLFHDTIDQRSAASMPCASKIPFNSG
jgi:hypothetical protein